MINYKHINLNKSSGEGQPSKLIARYPAKSTPIDLAGNGLFIFTSPRKLVLSGSPSVSHGRRGKIIAILRTRTAFKFPRVVLSIAGQGGWLQTRWVGNSAVAGGLLQYIDPANPTDLLKG